MEKVVMILDGLLLACEGLIPGDTASSGDKKVKK